MKYQKNYASTRPQMYDEKSRIDKAKKAEKVLRNYLNNLSDLTMLDIGSSSGIIANYFASKVKKVYGIDIDEQAIKHAQKIKKHKNVIFKTGDAMHLPFEDKKFNVVLCMHVYEHVPNSNKLFQEIHRVLKDDGICYLAAQNSAWPIEPHYNLPFLSYLPQKLANIYIRIFTNKNEYYEHPLNYFKLKNMLKNFEITDYTQKIFENPTKYGYKSNIFINRKFKVFAKYFSPTFIWIIKKK